MSEQDKSTYRLLKIPSKNKNTNEKSIIELIVKFRDETQCGLIFCIKTMLAEELEKYFKNELKDEFDIYDNIESIELLGDRNIIHIDMSSSEEI